MRPEGVGQGWTCSKQSYDMADVATGRRRVRSLLTLLHTARKTCLAGDRLRAVALWAEITLNPGQRERLLQKTAGR